jgi:hypothetical protein
MNQNPSGVQILNSVPQALTSDTTAKGFEVELAIAAVIVAAHAFEPA